MPVLERTNNLSDERYWYKFVVFVVAVVVVVVVLVVEVVVVAAVLLLLQGKVSAKSKIARESSFSSWKWALVRERELELEWE